MAATSSTRENSNFARICRLLIDYGARALRDVLDKRQLPSTLHSVLHKPAVQNKLKGLRPRIINNQQWSILYPASTTTPVTSASFDMTLLVVLLRNICGLTTPGTGWDKPPVPADLSLEADVARIKWYRNELYGHIREPKFSDCDFVKYWSEITTVLVRLGGPHNQPDFESLKIEALDPDDEKRYIKTLKEWKASDQQVIDKLVNVEENLESAIKVGNQQTMDQLKEIELAVKVGNQQTMDQLKEIGDKLHNVGAGGNTHSTQLILQKVEEKYYAELIAGPQPHGTEGIADVKIITTKDNHKNLKTLKGCVVKNDDTFKSFLSSLLDATEYCNIKYFLCIPDCDVEELKHCDCVEINVNIYRLKAFKAPKQYYKKVLQPVEINKDVIIKGNHGFLPLMGEKFEKSKFLKKYSKSIDNSILPENLYDRKCFGVEKGEGRPKSVEFKLTLKGTGSYRMNRQDPGRLEFCSSLYAGNNDDMPQAQVIGFYVKQGNQISINTFQGSAISVDLPTTSQPGHISRDPPPEEEHTTVPTNREGSAILVDIPTTSQPGHTSRDPPPEEEHTTVPTNREDYTLMSEKDVEWRCEWSITLLPDTKTELYRKVINREVIKVFIQKHSSSKYEEMAETELQAIWNKLAELAFNLMKENKIIFDENDMKKLNFSEKEITNLKASNLFLWYSGVKKSQIVFTDVTLKEFLCAFSFVEIKKRLPEIEETNDVTKMFVAGLLSRKKDEKLMEKLLETIPQEGKIYHLEYMNRVLRLQCLYEYRDDELSKRVIRNLHDEYCDSDGKIIFIGVGDIDCVLYLIHIIGLLNEEQTRSFIVKSLDISYSPFSPSRLKWLCDSLVKISTLTELWLRLCGLDDNSIDIICNSSMLTFVNVLILTDNNITDLGVTSICTVIIEEQCHVEGLNLFDNDKITAECKKSVRELVQQHKPGVRLYLDESDLYNYK